MGTDFLFRRDNWTDLAWEIKIKIVALECKQQCAFCYIFDI